MSETYSHTWYHPKPEKIGQEDYFSLFNLDRSRSSLSRGDDLNLSSNSAYFFWFSSAKQGWKSEAILSFWVSVECSWEYKERRRSNQTIKLIEEVKLRQFRTRNRFNSWESRQKPSICCNTQKLKSSNFYSKFTNSVEWTQFMIKTTSFWVYIK